MFHQSGGCCDGSSPMLPAGEFIVGDRDVLLGELRRPGVDLRAAVPDLEHTQVILDVVAGRVAGSAWKPPRRAVSHPGGPSRPRRTRSWPTNRWSPGRAAEISRSARRSRSTIAGSVLGIVNRRDTPASGMAAHKRVTPRLRRGSDRRSRCQVVRSHDHPSRSCGRAGHRHSERVGILAILVSGRRWVYHRGRVHPAIGPGWLSVLLLLQVVSA